MDCQSCKWWVPYNASRSCANRGECTLLGGSESPVKITALSGSDTFAGDDSPINVGQLVIVTPFDFGCTSFTEYVESEVECDSQEG